MKKLLLLSLTVLLGLKSNSQVLGLSADKLAAMNPLSIPARTVEFEPAFGYLWSKKYFDNNGQSKSLSENDSISVLQSLVFRTTYGFAKNFEAGALVSSDLSTFSAGVKFTFFQSEKSAIAAVLGTTFSNESDIVLRNSGFFGKTLSVAGGFVFTNQLSEKFAIDYDFQYQNIADMSSSYSDDLFINADLSFKIKEGFRVVEGLSYRYNHFKSDMEDAYLLTLNTGFVVSTGRTFILVLNIPYDLAGKNVAKYSGFTFALTIFLD
jgi:hypothetical protein